MKSFGVHKHILLWCLVINYLNDFWTPRHVNVGLFEVHEITRLFMVRQLHILFEKVWFDALCDYFCEI
jgi:hypothetical protein